jgi:hypothetical protein
MPACAQHLQGIGVWTVIKACVAANFVAAAFNLLHGSSSEESAPPPANASIIW